MIERLSRPLTAVEAQFNWTSKDKVSLKNLFQAIYDDLATRKNPSNVFTCRTMARDLDYMGISNGDLHDDVVSLALRIAEIDKEKP